MRLWRSKRGSSDETEAASLLIMTLMGLIPKTCFFHVKFDLLKRMFYYEQKCVHREYQSDSP